MAIIDSDTHVIETDRTWDYLAEKDKRFRPKVFIAANPDKGGNEEKQWVIDGDMYPMRLFDPEKTGTPQGARELEDVDLRLKHMDELGVDLQVIYPTTLLGLFCTARRETQVALCQAYNRWIADICAQSKGRLRWVVAPPVRDMDAAIAELRLGKEKGACGVMMHGLVDDLPPNDPYLFPLYEEASNLDLPICFHAGEGSPALRSVLHSRANILWRAKVPVFTAFHTLILSKLPDRFPQIRWGFVETGASWLPYIMHDLGARNMGSGTNISSVGRVIKPADPDLLRKNRMYVACEVHDDLPYITKYVGDDNIVAGSDYGHADTSSVLDALGQLKQQGEREEVSQETLRKIMDDNARALYGL
ncbi:MAG: hypothetical protein C1O27_002284 [Chloroflexi bacterium]|jgi:hypothetical protein|nr:MAG: hypothetical protein C1O27_002284 [Chloroflexota bacterium]